MIKLKESITEDKIITIVITVYLGDGKFTNWADLDNINQTEQPRQQFLFSLASFVHLPLHNC